MLTKAIGHNLCHIYAPGEYDIVCTFDVELFEAWEHMTYGGVQVVKELYNPLSWEGWQVVIRVA